MADDDIEKDELGDIGELDDDAIDDDDFEDDSEDDFEDHDDLMDDNDNDDDDPTMRGGHAIGDFDDAAEEDRLNS